MKEYWIEDHDTSILTFANCTISIVLEVMISGCGVYPNWKDVSWDPDGRIFESRSYIVYISIV